MEYNFNQFKERALNNKLSPWEKIGFPDDYRKNTELNIFKDIITKCDMKDKKNLKILDIGCGCSNLVNYIIKYSIKFQNELHLVDSLEMINNISLLKNSKYKKIKLIYGQFPDIKFFEGRKKLYDVIIIYSVLQYVFLYQNLFSFIHKTVEILKPGGRILIGDIPNTSKRKRFLDSSEGLKFKNNLKAQKKYNLIVHEEIERIDDAVIFSILQRFRNYNCETYLLSQNKDLPFYNRREDILIIKR